MRSLWCNPSTPWLLNPTAPSWRPRSPPVPPIAPLNGLLLPIAAAPNAPPAPPNSWIIAQLHDQQLSYFVIQNIYYNNGANDGSRLVFPTAMQALVECARLNVALQAMVRAVPGWEDWVFPYTGEGWSVEMLCHGVAIPRYAGGFWPNSFAGIVGKAIYAGILANMEQMTLGHAEQLNGVQRVFLVIPIAVQQMMNDAAGVLKQLTEDFSNTKNLAQIQCVEKSMFDSVLITVPPGLVVDGEVVGAATNLVSHLSIADRSIICVPVGGKARSPGSNIQNLFNSTYASQRIRGPNGELSDSLEIICSGTNWQFTLVGCEFMVLKWSDINDLINSERPTPLSPNFSSIQSLLRANATVVKVVTHAELENEILVKHKEILRTAADDNSPWHCSHTFSSSNRVVGANGDDNNYNRVMMSLKFLFELLKKLGFTIEVSVFDRTKCNILLKSGPDGNEINKYVWVGYSRTDGVDDRVYFKWGIDSPGGMKVAPTGMTDAAIWVCAPILAASAGGAMDKSPTEIQNILNIDNFLSAEDISFVVMNMSDNNTDNPPHNVYNVLISPDFKNPEEINPFKQKVLKTNFRDFEVQDDENANGNESKLSQTEAKLFGLSNVDLTAECVSSGIIGGRGRTDFETCENLISFYRYGIDWRAQHRGQLQYSFGNSIGQNHTTKMRINKVDLQPQGTTIEENERSSVEQMIRRGCMGGVGLRDRLPNIAMGREARLISIDRQSQGRHNLREAVFNKIPFST
ncbi:hypothetical protein ScalyP_jg7298, partial [Parmales sp. scaly parma]